MAIPAYAQRAIPNFFGRHLLGLSRLLYHSAPGDPMESLHEAVELIPYYSLSPDQLYVVQRTALAGCFIADHWDAWQQNVIDPGYFYPVFMHGLARGDGKTPNPDTKRAFALRIERGRYANKWFMSDLPRPGYYVIEQRHSLMFAPWVTPESTTLDAEIQRCVDAQDIHRAIARYTDMSNNEILVSRSDAVSLFTEEVRNISREVAHKFLHTFIGSPFTTWKGSNKMPEGLETIWNMIGAGDYALFGAMEFYYLRRLFYSMFLSASIVAAWREKIVKEFDLPAVDNFIWADVDGTLDLQWGIRERQIFPAHPEYFMREDNARKPQWDELGARVKGLVKRIKGFRNGGHEDDLYQQRLGVMQGEWFAQRNAGMIPSFKPMPMEKTIVKIRQQKRWKKKNKVEGA